MGVGVVAALLLAVSLPAAQSLLPLLNVPLNKQEDVVVKGHRLISANNRGIWAFEGIRYAQPPGNALRFKPPLPPLKYPDLVTATKKEPPCPFLNPRGQVVGSEDCLFLNVYVPEDAQAGEELPVLVMLPGLGWAGRWKPNRILDRRLVLVTVQSRSGALGYLTTDTDEAPGNAGLRDEAMALEWVRNNIRGFFGDPNRITLGGVGVGAASVQLHMLSPLSSGLFNRSITISGSALSPWAITTDIREALGLTQRLADSIGCNCSHPNASFPSTTEIVECLQKKPVADIILATRQLQSWMGLPPSPFAPVVDGDFLSDSPRALWEAGRVAKVPVLAGLARGEGLQTLSIDVNNGLLDNATLLKELHQNWNRFAPVLLAFNATPAEQRDQVAMLLRERYFHEDFSPSGANSPSSVAAREALLRLVADRHVVVPALRALSLHSVAAGRVAYLYLYSWTGSSEAQNTSALNGPEGGRDAEMLFMEPSPSENTRYPLLRAMTTDLLDLWANFVTTGKPAVGNTTLKPSGEISEGGDQTSLTLTGPGELETTVVLTQETLAFWDSLPLPENNRSQSTRREAGSHKHAHHGKSHAARTSGSEALCLIFSVTLLVMKVSIA